MASISKLPDVSQVEQWQFSHASVASENFTEFIHAILSSNFVNKKNGWSRESQLLLDLYYSKSNLPSFINLVNTVRYYGKIYINSL